ncbi:MAG: glycoside hydrolase family 3 C-terminal domain-containing protein [Bacteroidales bacterium]|nr:glycoside hydrolase family 3 C-terminal domain-containing protein [Bacteroidales bacterium]
MKKLNRLIIIVIFLCSLTSCYNKTDSVDIDKIIEKMTLEQKIDFIGGIDRFNIRSYDSLGIPEIRMADGPVGVRNYGPSTAYPASITLAASWDVDLANAVGSAIGMEARVKNVHVMLGPAINIYRAPMCGRNFEYLGEDPFLAGKIASGYIRGMQNQGVMATAKHYTANYMEYDRHNGSSDIDERTLREIYLPAFKACVKEGDVAAVMTAYNLINGIHASQHDHLINKILKEEWGFRGFVMSDWTSTYDGVAAAKAGLDIEMPEGTFMNRDTLIPAIEDGRLEEKIIDDKVRRILNAYKRFGYFEKDSIAERYILDSNLIRKTAIDAARGGMVLLKNDDNTLPIDRSKVKSIAVIGPNAHPAVTGGGGSSYTKPLFPLSLYEAIQQVAGDDIEVKYETGMYGQEPMPIEFFNNSEFYTYKDNKKIKGLKAEFRGSWRRDAPPDYIDYFDNINLEFKDSIPGIPRKRFAVFFTGFLKVKESGIYGFVVSCNSGYNLSIDDQEVVGAWRNEGEEVRSAAFKLNADQVYKIKLFYFQRDKTGIIRVSYQKPEEYKHNLDNAMNKAIDLAKNSDITILSVGYNSETEHEGNDRSMDLSEEQQVLINRIIESNKDIAVVLNAGGNVNMPWLDKTKGLLYAWYPGQEGNLAAAEILFGVTNPSGKLPVSFEKKWEDNATYNSYYDDDGDKRIEFKEGIFLGYRHFDNSNIKPLFPFGYGLSYTKFEYSDLKLNKETFNNDDGVTLTLKVKNTGNYDGSEIVQVYVSDPESSLPRPVKELKAFTKIHLKAGEEKKVKLELSPEAFQYFNPDEMRWITEPGDFEIMVASSSEDIRLKAALKISE